MLISEKRGFKDDYERASEMLILGATRKIGPLHLGSLRGVECLMEKLSISAIKAELKTIISADDHRLAEFRQDTRKVSNWQ